MANKSLGQEIKLGQRLVLRFKFVEMKAHVEMERCVEKRLKLLLCLRKALNSCLIK
jgi:hypothetical protein